MKTLVIIPGMDGSGRLFLPLVERLRSRGWRVLLIDHCDETPWLLPGAGVDQLVERVREEMESAGADEAVICGESFGSAAALSFVARFPERTRGLVVLSGFAWLPFVWRRRALGVLHPVLSLVSRAMPTGLLRLARHLWNPLLGRAERKVLGSAPRRMHVPTARCLVAKTRLAMAFDGREDLVRCTVPAVVVAGTRDRVIPPECATDLARRLPQSRLITIPDGGHLAHHTETDLLVRVLEELCSGAVAQPGS